MNIPKMNMKWIANNHTVLIIGKRGVGKTFLTKDLLYYHQDIPDIIIVSGNKNDYDGKDHKYTIHQEFHPQIIENIIEKQKKTTAIVILDNCLYDSTCHIQPLVYNDSFMKVITIPFLMGMFTKIREQVNYIFIFQENYYPNRKKIYDCFGHMFSSFDLFSQIMDTCCQQNECLVIDNMSGKLFWYKADNHDFS
jgi:predicted AAA+ superfamily ATPase